MQDRRVSIIGCAVFAMLLHGSWSTGEGDCSDASHFQVLEKCCNIPDDELLTEEEKAVGMMCDKSVFQEQPLPSSEEERLELYECMDECFYNATHLLTPDMKLNETAIRAEYDVSTENFPYWKEPITKAVNTCIQKNVVQEVKPEAKCKSGSYQFSRCFGVHLYLNCPQENWKAEDKGCEKAREILRTCIND